MYGRLEALAVSIGLIDGPFIEAEVVSFNVGTPVSPSVVKSLFAAAATGSDGVAAE
jgi:hypothetical protein